MRVRSESVTTSVLALFLCASYIPTTHSQSHSRAADSAYTIETDLQSLLQDTTLSQEKELSETLAWYQKLPSEGSCVQLAAMKLMSECKLLDNPSDFAKAHPDLYLDDVKVEYAVKLANCEIVGAQPDRPIAPQHCEVFIPSTEACNKRSWNLWGRAQPQPLQHLPCYPQATENNLHQCLKTLRESPQYWTSFSNAKFRAVNMCQLSRHAIEREKTLQLHKNLTHITFRVQASLHNVQSNFEAFQTEFKHSTDHIKHSTDQFRRFAEDARREAQQDREQAKQDMQTVQVEIATVHDMVISNISTYNARFNEAVDASITKAITAVNEGHVGALASIGSELERFYQSLKAEGLQLAASMNAEIQNHHEKALLALQIEHGTMMQSYSIMSESLGAANHMVDGINVKFDVLHAKTDDSLAKIGILDDRLDRLGTKFKTVERAFVVLDTLFSVGATGLLIVAIVLGFCAVCMVSRAFQGSTWYIVALSASCTLFYLLSSHHFFEKFKVSKNYTAIEPPFSIMGYLQASPTGFWTMLATISFLLAALLPKINSSCERLRDSIAALPGTLYSHVQPFQSHKIQSIVSTTSASNTQSRHIRTYQDNAATPPEFGVALLPQISCENSALRTSLGSFQRAQSVA
jgi:hypothetical protein